MNTRKLVISLASIIAGIIAVSLFWRNTQLLIIVVLILAVIKHILTPIKHEVLMFLIMGFIGAGGESIIMHLSGAWAYTSPQLLNIPLWLPFLWGLAGIVSISLYESISGH